MDFSGPVKLTDIAYIETSNGRLRTESLNASWFLSLADARERIEGGRCHDNDDQSLTALGALTHRAFADRAVTARELAKKLYRKQGQPQLTRKPYLRLT
ncbi:hypothetical protein MEX01_19140 [Methylorubrum extorquens]|nr:hypothetical protein MEX01_19140 [Methylorubrum extorquens]